MAEAVGAVRIDMAANVAEIQGDLRKIAGSFDALGGDLKRFSVLASRSFAAINFALLAREAAQLADAYTNMTNRLKFVTRSTEELEAVQARLYQIAQGTRQGLVETTELYARMAFALRNAGVSQNEVLQFTENLNKALTLSGAAGSEASGALIQLSQGLASSTLRGQELNSVMEQTPYVAALIAKQLGVTTGELRKLGQEGKITGDQVFRALINATDELDQKFGSTTPTIAQGFTTISNSLLNLAGRLNEATGAGEKFAGWLITAAGWVDSLAKNIDRLASSLRLLWPEGSTGQDLFGMPTMRDALNVLGHTAELTADLDTKFETVTKAVERTTEELQEAKRALDNLLATDTVPFAERYAAINKALQDQVITTEQAARMTRRAKEQEGQAWQNLATEAASALTTIFENNKSAAIGAAIINTLVGITKAFELPFPFNWAQASLVAATGFAQVQKIRSTSKSAAGGSASLGGKSSASGSSASGGDSSGSNGPAQTISVSLVGRVFDREQVRELIEGFNDAIADGARLYVK